jgi:hypothetical protein
MSISGRASRDTKEHTNKRETNSQTDPVKYKTKTKTDNGKNARRDQDGLLLLFAGARGTDRSREKKRDAYRS